MKPFSLLLYSSVLDSTQTFLGSLGKLARGWKRSIRSSGGFWQGSFTVAGDEATLRGYFNSWLGLHLAERYGAMTSWEGMQYELELQHAGLIRRRSLEDLANAVRATYTTMIYSGDNLCLNPGYESLGGGGGDPFASWVENQGTDGLVEAAGGVGEMHGGAYGCKITQDTDGPDPGGTPYTYCRQNINVTAGNSYQWTFWTRGDGAHAGRYGVRDPNTATWIVAITSTGVTGATYTQKTVTFTGPSDGEAVLYCFAGSNAADVAYFDDHELLEKLEVVQTSSWASEASSIAHFGRKELTLLLDRYPQTTSEALRDTRLAELVRPWPRAISAGPPAAALLTVRVCGYIFTANWMHLVEGDGADHNVEHWLGGIVGSAFGLSANHGGSTAGAGDCQFLTAGLMGTNTLQVTEETTIDERPWDRMRELAELGDSSGNPWRLWCDTGRLVHYQAISTTPRYYWRNGQFYESISAKSPVAPWLIRPAVVRDLEYPVGTAEEGSWLTDARDVYLEEVEVDEDGIITPKLMLYSEADAMAAQLQRLQK